MKKIIGLGLILSCCFMLFGCSNNSQDDAKEETKSSSEVLEEKADKLLKGKVKVPDPYFKTKEFVEAEFESVGLTPKFVVSNFDEKATTNKRLLRVDECDQLSSDQAAVEYFDMDQVGDRHGYYADKGSTIIVGYSDHDFDGTGGNEEAHPSSSTEEPAVISEESSNESSGTAFQPKDVSDETIKSIVTYDDYLAMYQKIIENYLSEYESAIKDTALYSKETFDQQKQQYDSEFAKQKEEYKDTGNKKIIGKDSLVDFLIGLRDNLTETVNGIKESL